MRVGRARSQKYKEVTISGYADTSYTTTISFERRTEYIYIRISHALIPCGI
jgi:hypothetical protein